MTEEGVGDEVDNRECERKRNDWVRLERMLIGVEVSGMHVRWWRMREKAE
jgi:hypothetical protein